MYELIGSLIYTYCEEMTTAALEPICVVVLRSPSIGVKKVDNWTDTEFRFLGIRVADIG